MLFISPVFATPSCQSKTGGSLCLISVPRNFSITFRIRSMYTKLRSKPRVYKQLQWSSLQISPFSLISPVLSGQKAGDLVVLLSCARYTTAPSSRVKEQEGRQRKRKWVCPAHMGPQIPTQEGFIPQSFRVVGPLL